MNMMNSNNVGNSGTSALLSRPRLSFYHPNGKGTGCALQLELHPAHDKTDGSIMLSIANQLTVGNREAGAVVFPRFDWEHKIIVKLSFTDLCKMLQVFRGECESIEDGKGLYHSAPNRVTRILFRHLVEPINGYSLDVYRTENKTQDTSARILFSPAEALGLCEAISGSMSVIGFGLPMVIRHNDGAKVETELDA